LLISYDSTGQELQRDQVPIGGFEYDRPGTAAHWLFTAPGYQDAQRNDVLNYDVFEETLISKYRWVKPALLGVAAYWVINKFF
ncbi:MAG TPA: hypothetical protein VLD19_18355, partial [Chitinophagaceae bacterium]|nr:hypothetical protein [Chitinophagaceae bacterium]